ncbi:hypothetical protein BLNAU_14925 [Blattamonas nauphoetae]|uniref:Uncharacterized protein n=1 Tax=Blattamonas nauphoetae TaxID=2049346 RepID=A0ABQ9XC91_9EUKA|nr:hypothetical protein BLNAU_14925 [Blattamonas nauphoetae]
MSDLASTASRFTADSPLPYTRFRKFDLFIFKALHVYVQNQLNPPTWVVIILWAITSFYLLTFPLKLFFTWDSHMETFLRFVGYDSILFMLFQQLFGTVVLLELIRPAHRLFCDLRLFAHPPIYIYCHHHNVFGNRKTASSIHWAIHQTDRLHSCFTSIARYCLHPQQTIILLLEACPQDPRLLHKRHTTPARHHCTHHTCDTHRLYLHLSLFRLRIEPNKEIFAPSTLREDIGHHYGLDLTLVIFLWNFGSLFTSNQRIRSYSCFCRYDWYYIIISAILHSTDELDHPRHFSDFNVGRSLYILYSPHKEVLNGDWIDSLSKYLAFPPHFWCTNCLLGLQSHFRSQIFPPQLVGQS